MLPHYLTNAFFHTCSELSCWPLSSRISLLLKTALLHQRNKLSYLKAVPIDNIIVSDVLFETCQAEIHLASSFYRIFTVQYETI